MKTFKNYVFVYDIIVDRVYWATMKTRSELMYSKLMDVAKAKYPTLNHEINKGKEIVFVKTNKYCTDKLEDID